MDGLKGIVWERPTNRVRGLHIHLRWREISRGVIRVIRATGRKPRAITKIASGSLPSPLSNHDE